MLVEGVAVEYRAAGGAIRGAQVRVIDFDEPDANTWMAINQFTVTESGNTRRPDIVVFVNDPPLAVIELKNPADENATIWSAFQQLQTYKAELPSLFACNAVLAVSDGMQARVGTLSAGREWFKPWRTIDGQELAPAFYTELQVLVEGVFEKRRFLSLLRDFIVFEDDSGELAKKMAGYHQFHAVQAAVGETLRAAALQEETRRIAETGGRYEAGRQPGGDGRRPQDRRRLAHPGFGEEPDHGVLRWAHHPRAGDGQPDRGRADRPQRSRRPALRYLCALPGSAAPAAGAGRQPGGPARQARGGGGRRCIHHHSEVLSGGEG